MTEKLLREIWEDDLTPKKKILNRNLAENDLFDAEENDSLIIFIKLLPDDQIK